MVLRFLKKSKKSELEKLLGNYTLPSFPAAVMNVLSMIRDPESSISEIANQIQMDPGLHIKILQTVNSPVYGLMSKVSNLQHGVTLLGRSRLEAMVLSFAISDTIPASSVKGFDIKKFWITAARKASLARVLALHLHSATQAECFTAALLQDMGIPLLSSALPKKYNPVLEKWIKDKSAPLIELEKDALGYDHAYLGASMAKQWGLPEYLINAIADHHKKGNDTSADPAIRLVAHILYSGEKYGEEQLINDCIQEHAMDEEMAREMIDNAYSDADKYSKIFN